MTDTAPQDRKVWVVTTGEYSNYSVHSVWSTSEEAEAYADRLEDANVVEDYPLRSGLPNPAVYYEMYGRWPEEPFYASIREKGAVPHEGWDEDPYVMQKVVPIASTTHVFPGDDGPKRSPYQRGSTIDLRVWGTSQERVAKVFSEKWAQIKADFVILVEAQRQEEAERHRPWTDFDPVRKAMVDEAGHPVDYVAMLDAFNEAGEDPEKAMEIIRAAGFPQ